MNEHTCTPHRPPVRRLQVYYRATSRELRRLEALARSPVYSTFSEALEGAPVVRAHARQPHFAALNRTQVRTLQEFQGGGMVKAFGDVRCGRAVLFRK